ncbi:hypothetical protein QZH41_019997 [Actinostola sp. cb2023]|nr:hypothetical protein QZH41_019997 [Actinostola sp. cb2023]
MDEGKYKLWWSFVNASDTFFFKVEVEAKGWIGFGFSLLKSETWMRDSMSKYDVLVAGVFTNGTVYGKDYLTSYLNTTQYPDHIDAVNDWVITSGEEKGGKTILEFNRKRVTDDLMTNAVPSKGDIALTPGLRNFVWAYHKTKDTPYLDHISLKHDKSGLQKVMLIKEEEKEPIHIDHPAKRAKGNSNLPVISTLSFICGSLLSVITAVYI